MNLRKPGQIVSKLAIWQRHSCQLHEAIGGGPNVEKIGDRGSRGSRVGRSRNCPDHLGASRTYSVSRCGNTSGRVLLTFDDWAYGDPYRATRVGAYLKSRNIRAAYFLINKEAQKYPSIVSTLRQQGHWVLNHTYSHPNLTHYRTRV